MCLSPRLRRLRSDLRAIEQLKGESTILDFSIPGPMFGGPPEEYVVIFKGKGLWLPEGSSQVRIRTWHQVRIGLGAAYPRMMPELVWKTPIFHPNISSNGAVCLGGYSTHWVPSLQLDELCTMLWDMIRYQNFDVESPYNRLAAQWVREQQTFAFPLDSRPIRDRRAQAAVEPTASESPRILFLDDEEEEIEIVEAEIVDEEEDRWNRSEILYIE